MGGEGVGMPLNKAFLPPTCKNVTIVKKKFFMCSHSRWLHSIHDMVPISSDHFLLRCNRHILLSISFLESLQAVRIPASMKAVIIAFLVAMVAATVVQGRVLTQARCTHSVEHS
jgi:hypothetical protein